MDRSGLYLPSLDNVLFCRDSIEQGQNTVAVDSFLYNKSLSYRNILPLMNSNVSIDGLDISMWKNYSTYSPERN